MSKLAVALGSFMVGAIASMWIVFSGNQLSITEQSWAETRGFTFPGGVPKVPSVLREVIGSKFVGVTQSLDGINFVDCEFTDVTIEYSGGQYILDGVVFSGKNRLVFKGAADNTLSLLGLRDKLSGHELIPIPNTPIPPNKRYEFETKNPTTITLSSPDIKR